MTQIRQQRWLCRTGTIRAMILRRLETCLMPPRCVFCAARSESFEHFICTACKHDLPWCSPLCVTDDDPLSVVAAPLEYAFPIDAALKLLKFRRRCDYLPAFSELLWQVARELPDDIDALLPMPLHWRRHAMRGFNQAFELCRRIHKLSALPLLQGVRRIRATPFQSGLDAAERSRNLRGAFVANNPVTAQHVLIVDDVITTGESCRQLAQVVLDAGAQKVSALAVART